MLAREHEAPSAPVYFGRVVLRGAEAGRGSAGCGSSAPEVAVLFF